MDKQTSMFTTAWNHTFRLARPDAYHVSN